MSDGKVSSFAEIKASITLQEEREKWRETKEYKKCQEIAKFLVTEQIISKANDLDAQVAELLAKPEEKHTKQRGFEKHNRSRSEQHGPVSRRKWSSNFIQKKRIESERNHSFFPNTNNLRHEPVMNSPMSNPHKQWSSKNKEQHSPTQNHPPAHRAEAQCELNHVKKLGQNVIDLTSPPPMRSASHPMPTLNRPPAHRAETQCSLNHMEELGQNFIDLTSPPSTRSASTPLRKHCLSKSLHINENNSEKQDLIEIAASQHLIPPLIGIYDEKNPNQLTKKPWDIIETENIMDILKSNTKIKFFRMNVEVNELNLLICRDGLFRIPPDVFQALQVCHSKYLKYLLLQEIKCGDELLIGIARVNKDSVQVEKNCEMKVQLVSLSRNNINLRYCNTNNIERVKSILEEYLDALKNDFCEPVLRHVYPWSGIYETRGVISPSNMKKIDTEIVEQSEKVRTSKVSSDIDEIPVIISTSDMKKIKTGIAEQKEEVKSLKGAKDNYGISKSTDLASETTKISERNDLCVIDQALQITPSSVGEDAVYTYTDIRYRESPYSNENRENSSWEDEVFFVTNDIDLKKNITNDRRSRENSLVDKVVKQMMLNDNSIQEIVTQGTAGSIGVSTQQKKSEKIQNSTKDIAIGHGVESSMPDTGDTQGNGHPVMNIIRNASKSHMSWIDIEYQNLEELSDWSQSVYYMYDIDTEDIKICIHKNGYLVLEDFLMDEVKKSSKSIYLVLRKMSEHLPEIKPVCGVMEILSVYKNMVNVCILCLSRPHYVGEPWNEEECFTHGQKLTLKEDVRMIVDQYKMSLRRKKVKPIFSDFFVS